MASKTIAVRTALHTLIGSTVERRYYDHANDDAAFPYCVYSLDEVIHDEFQTVCNLEVNVMDYGTSSSACETLADSLQAALDHYHYIDNDIEFETYADTRNVVQEEDKKIIRRRLLFELRLRGR